MECVPHPRVSSEEEYEWPEDLEEQDEYSHELDSHIFQENDEYSYLHREEEENGEEIVAYEIYYPYGKDKRPMRRKRVSLFDEELYLALCANTPPWSLLGLHQIYYDIACGRKRNGSKHPRKSSLIPKVRSMMTYDEDGAINNFRFTIPEIRTIAHLLRDHFGLSCDIFVNYKPDIDQAIAMLCYYLAHGYSMTKLAEDWGTSRARINGILMDILSFIHKTFHLKLIQINESLVKSRLPLYEQALLTGSCNLISSVWGMIDGTVINANKPSFLNFEGAKEFFCSKDATYAQKYLGVVTPDGLCVGFFGPYPGSYHDGRCYREANMAVRISNIDPRKKILADSGWTCSDELFVPIKKALNAPRCPLDIVWNRLLSKDRIGVEWYFGELKKNWERLNKHGFISRSSFAWGIDAAILLENLRICFRKQSQCSQYFDVEPISPLQYLLSLK